ncbi:MAG: roadblock/LC7 domain-containing protein [Comamonas sp.]|jgi:predicted regulator of Ras-like GTPase activity (Roadblock/LC7/MglB family)|uniref:roadblock/LC7 domain-containing protein n=1 Tax=Comamonas sp. TaxID=34028 RepID=UPI002821327E|nr:roadblock/LC7 domain-containing protein [Comamonas sp.]MDR0213342.1 roadblock/LC7 domain-containing protein [Comamonas sp.]MDR2296982.1 roadblock/LC7 domain-containing protein [Comamonas sp.]
MKTHTSPVIPAEVVQAGRDILLRAVSPVEGVRIALLCTPDGFEITALRIHSELPTERLSAMAGSLMAMAKAVANEIGHQDCRRLTFETESGTVVFQAIGGQFPAVLCLVVDQNALLGRALWAAGEVAAGFMP